MSMIRGLLLAAALLLGLPAAAAAQNPTPPVVTTAAATSLAQNAATIPGTVDPNGAATTYEIRYGTSTSYGLRSTQRSAAAAAIPSRSRCASPG